MPVESAADRLTMLQDFGITVTLSDSTEITAIFDDEYRDTLDVAASQPVLMCRTQDVSGLTHGDEVLVEGAPYLARVIQPDGTGITLIFLEQLTSGFGTGYGANY